MLSTGTIPSTLSSLSSLSKLYLYQNLLSGNILLKKLQSSMHPLVTIGRINDRTIINFISVEYGVSCTRKGSIPSELGELSKLYKLQIDANSLTGMVLLEF